MSKFKMLVAFSDPGGALAAIPVVNEILRNEIAEVKVFSGKASTRLTDEQGLAVEELKYDLTSEDAEKIISKEMPDILFTATGGGRAEQELRNSARRNHVRSYAVIDFWKHYSRRWLYSDHELDEIEDTIFVMDQDVKREMIAEGFPESRIIVTGHPYIEQLFKETNREEMAEDFRESYLFLSQPSETIGLKNTDTHPLELVGNALEELSEADGKKFTLHVKLHPLESDDGIQRAIRKLTLKNTNVVMYPRESSAPELIAKSGTVIGYNSIALFESCSANKRTFSIEAIDFNDPMRKAMLQAGIEFVSPDIKSLKDAFQNTASVGKAKQGFHKGATLNCINAIFSEMSLRKAL